MKKWFLMICIMFLCGFVFSQVNGVKQSIVVPSFKGKGVSVEDMEFVTELFIAEYSNMGLATVVDRGNLDKIMAEQKFQEDDWSNPDKIEALGTILNAQQLLIGQFQRRENSDKIVLIIKITAVKGGGIIASETVILKDIDELLNDGQNSVKSICERLSKRASGKVVSTSSEKKVISENTIDKAKQVDNKPSTNEATLSVVDNNSVVEYEKVWVPERDTTSTAHYTWEALSWVAGGLECMAGIILTSFSGMEEELLVPGLICLGGGVSSMLFIALPLSLTHSYSGGYWEQRPVSRTDNKSILTQLVILPAGVALNFDL